MRTRTGSQTFTQVPTKLDGLEDSETGVDSEEADEDTEDDDDLNPETPMNDTEVTLERNCYTLVVVGCRHQGTKGGVKALLCVILNSICQCSAIYMVTIASPEHYFGNGAWLVPITQAWSTNCMKAFASVLVIFQVLQEMQDVSTIFRTVTHSPKLHIKSKHRWQCLAALLLQYLFALVVLVVAMQLVLSRHRPLDTMFVTYYIFLTLNFDNMLCRFILFVFEIELDWSFTLKAPSTQVHRKNNRFYKNLMRILFLVVPVLLTIVIFFLAMVRNICPLTWLRYGNVSNDNPVLMISPNLGLPQGCCPLAVHWEANRTSEGLIPVLASVPCLSHNAPEDDPNSRPVLYWVVWPDQRVPPTSLQIREGRGGDGTPAKLSGRTPTHSWQMRLWLSRHGYDGDAVYKYLIDRSEGISLYRSKFTYVAEWNVTKIPWEDRNRIFVTAQNPRTGALSPTPVQSEILLRELCAPFCWRCADNGACLHCESHYAVAGTQCLPCADHCEDCSSNDTWSGPGGCQKCIAGYGLAKAYVSLPLKELMRMGLGRDKFVCMPCSGGAQNCSSCDLDKTEGAPDEEVLPCKKCAGQLGLDENGTCVSCKVGNCSQCETPYTCKTCEEGFTKYQTSALSEECVPCAKHCRRCDKQGPGKCDKDQCDESFARSYGADDCVTCSPNCKVCNISGPTGCNRGECERSFTQSKWQYNGACQPCSPHCHGCHEAGPGNCDKDMCESGFGLQGSQQCSRCAEDNCLRCDESWSKCNSCADGYGFSPTHTCMKCAENCRRCSKADKCTECEEGFRVSKSGACVACADQCRSCDETGEGFCDKNQCEDGWTTVVSNSSRNKEGLTCRPCTDPKCVRCDEAGPSGCDDKKTKHWKKETE